MKQQIKPTINLENSPQELWWQPLLSIQKNMNKLFKEEYSRFVPPSFSGPLLVDIEEGAFKLAQKNIHRLLSEIYNNQQVLMPWLTGANAEPLIDIIENSKAFKVLAQLPGVSSQDLDFSVTKNSLIISGQKQNQYIDEGDSYIHQECCSSSFRRVVALPKEADLAKSTAILENNILFIEIPKKDTKALKAGAISISSEKPADVINYPKNVQGEQDIVKRQDVAAPNKKETGQLPKRKSAA